MRDLIHWVVDLLCDAGNFILCALLDCDPNLRANRCNRCGCRLWDEDD